MAMAAHSMGENKFYFAGEKALENANAFVFNYEQQTLARFVKVKTERFGIPDRSMLSGRIRWEKNSKNMPIPFNGIPFLILGNQTQECSNGPDRHHARKEKIKKQLEDDFSVKRRRVIPSPKKMNCPAKICLRSVACFPTFQNENNNKSAKGKEAKRLRAALEDEGKEVVWEHRVYVALPGPDAHRNHLLAESCMTHDLHKDVISKIHELVTDGVRDVAEMKRHITTFSRANFPTVPNASNRFYPKKKCIRNHMDSARRLSHLGSKATSMDVKVAGSRHPHQLSGGGNQTLATLPSTCIQNVMFDETEQALQFLVQSTEEVVTTVTAEPSLVVARPGSLLGHVTCPVPIQGSPGPPGNGFGYPCSMKWEPEPEATQDRMKKKSKGCKRTLKDLQTEYYENEIMLQGKKNDLINKQADCAKLHMETMAKLNLVLDNMDKEHDK